MSSTRAVEKERSAAEAGIAARLRALDDLLAAGVGRLDEERLAPARRLAQRAGERLRLSGAHTVVALAGATGSGKSSLFNALTGADVSTVGVRRPTTGVAHAAVWGADGAGPLLDWLEIPRRHLVQARAGHDAAELPGLVLLDLPDHDSTVMAHRLEVDRLVALVDVLVWVLDPQKYADAAVHDRYLRPLARHGEVMVVVLNQVDRLPPAQVADALGDVRRLLADDGLDGVPVLGVSAVAPGGRDELRAVLTGAVAAHRAALRRVSADLDAVAASLSDVVAGPPRRELDATAVEALDSALSAAAGVPAVGAAVERASVHRAAAATGWPWTRWVRRLRPDPLRRLHLDRGTTAPDEESAVARTSLPEASAVERSRVDIALRALAATAADDLPEPWPDAVRAASRSREDDLPDALDRAVAGTDLGLAQPPRWWRAAGLLQTLLAVLALAGGVWLAGLYLLTLLRLPEPPTPTVQPWAGFAVPLPTALLLGGLLAGLLLALLARLLARIGASRRRARVQERLDAAVAEVADDLVLVPVTAELRAYGALRDAVAGLAPAPRGRRRG
ncbi:50S ribosome-binding GTPase [Pseudonocardia sp. KRD-184]|uniref:50S ribosome-binding GTPase n=1 Tax=Pseudonocardia oceani TaxID=2792013 RepID=A0ABS6U1M8_9PSEU|nr:GTPase [Pseudonocardia oceani]MBW0092542.1 50S ribosome-binding GTPase [Pseudonocardia oceani]MBW0099349.1 50S ribosome-binding GTPase [Pseudonocardia oceani]MBW0111945.1 50S ribosome-binding GTPase [Pseudonocardia oceani]MBW0124583.1 50S ribosome-binding GTPase [Pseudonocardia oceani]MBW0126143.1 50S ribosome-binding GTPase [Pseudonocardia oceani]